MKMTLPQTMAVHKLQLVGWTMIAIENGKVCLKKGDQWAYVNKYGIRTK